MPRRTFTLTLTLTLLLLPLLFAPTVARPPTPTIREELPIPSFNATTSDGVITFPSSPTLPPLLHGLTIEQCQNAKNLLIVNSPMLPVSGIATTTTTPSKTTITIRFLTPRVRVRLSSTPLSSPSLMLSGHAIHIFRRPFGLRIHRSRRSVNDSVSAVRSALAANPDGPRLMAVLDHSAAAASVGLTLPESSLIVFGNPAIGSVLWRPTPPIGVELPLELLAVTSPLGLNYVAWSASSLLRTRFELMGDDVEPTLAMIDAGLARLAGIAADRQFKPAGPRFDKSRIPDTDGLKTDRARGDAVEGWHRLLGALDEAEPVNVAFNISHEISAMNAGLETGGVVNRVVVFGNPALGTGIMQLSFTAAIDLPAKMGVWTTSEGASKYFVGYTKPRWIGRRHSVETPEMLTGALDNFAGVALGE